MDSSGSGFLRIPGLMARSSPAPELSPKDKRYWLQIEKALASFESLTEWADYIAFLSRLQKALLFADEPNSSVPWIPLADQVLAKLAACLNSKLPNGVHQKAISIYDLIFSKLTPQVLNSEISIWLQGTLPVLSYGSMQVKPQVLALYKNHLLVHLEPATLKTITRPFLLSLLAGLEDENSEVFADIMALIDSFKQKLADSPHFWQSLFLCIITSPEKRMGALNWCSARLPVLAAMKDSNGSKFSVEAQACLTPDLGLLVRAFATALDTHTTFNPATDVIVVRGFFDLLLSNLPLSSEVIASIISPSDKELLIMSCCKVTLKRDMSLNRRLWAWLLGPENSEESSGESRVNYFERTAAPILERGLLKQINSSEHLDQIQALKMSLSLILDRWEINQLLTPRIFVPILEASYKAFKLNSPKCREVISGAKAFFDEVEASYIWNYITCTLIAGSAPENLEMLEYLLHNFHFPEEERAIHIPLAILCLLSNYELASRSVSMLDLLIELRLPNSLAPLESQVDLDSYNKDTIVPAVKVFYQNLISDDSTQSPFAGSTLTYLIMNLLKNWYVESVQQNAFSMKLSSILSDFLYTVPNENQIEPFADRALIDSVLGYPFYKWSLNEGLETDMTTVFGIVNLCRYFAKIATPTEKSKILKIVLSNLWIPLVTSYPANYQVESVRHIFDLEICFDIHQIEAGILHMLLSTPSEIRVKSFYKLWVHSADLSDAEVILANPLHVVLDDLIASDKGNAMSVQKFVHNVITDGSAGRLLKLITDPLLVAPFMKAQHTEVNAHDDLTLFAYNLETVLNVTRSNEKLLKESFNHEFVVTESSEKFELIKSNLWDISNYKSLIVCIAQKFFSLKLSTEILNDRESLASFLSCTTSALDLYSTLITGSETDFETHFHFLIEKCLYFIQELQPIPFEIELVQAKYIKCILHFLNTAKSMNFNLNLLHIDESSKDPLLVRFIVQGITKCQSSTLLEKWFALLTSSIYQFNESVFSVILTLNDKIIEKIKGYMESVKVFDKATEMTDLEASLSILLNGLEDLLSISHSYLVTSNLRANAKSQTSNGDAGFLGNVILGVFLIESPSLRTEVQNKLYSILISFQDASKVAFDIWNWADSKPPVPKDCKVASAKSITYLANKLKFRSRKLLEALCELERQDVIETIIESPCETGTKVKILHVLDSGRSQITLPHILNSIITRCYPHSLGEKQLSSKTSLVTEQELSEFLVPYYESIDHDTVDDIWENSISFFREVLSHPNYYKNQLVSYLYVIKILSLKSNTKKVGDGRRNNKELSTIFLSMLSAATSNRVNEGDNANDAESSDAFLLELTKLVEYFGDILQESDKTNTAVTTIISSIIQPSVKVKAKITNELILELICSIGRSYPNKSWKQFVQDAFMDNNFFASKYSLQKGWQDAVAIWISSDKEKLTDYIARVTPSAQASAANIFIWNENSEVEDRIFILKRITYLILVLPEDLFASILDELFSRVSAALNSSCPPLYKSEAFNLFRVISLRFNEMQLLPHWLFIIQSLQEVFVDTVARVSKDALSFSKEQLKLVLSACKLLDQLLLIGSDEFSLGDWQFIGTSSVTDTTRNRSLMDQLAQQTEMLLTKEDPIAVSHPITEHEVAPLLTGVRSIHHIANLKKFFGLLSYICYERTYGLCTADISACNQDAFEDLYV
ncbi:CIC11C00000005257 [Sungouiella intermedia]|uniref:CIC11C00000005257 n=1 Tax=Sungouiella intermedia TaxID=45354 RepID=A0A1L0BJP2_9ASCO|nr:CIC11C00000005257 [[Candida] intermedia]